MNTNGTFIVALMSGVMMGLSAAILWHLSNIMRFGQHLIQEPDKLILLGEIGFMAIIFLFGIFLFIKNTLRGNSVNRRGDEV